MIKSEEGSINSNQVDQPSKGVIVPIYTESNALHYA
jgi:hypothetical protein